MSAAGGARLGSRSDGLSAELVEAARQGDGPALNQVCAHLQRVLRDYCRSQMGHRLLRWKSPEDIASAVVAEMARQLTNSPGILTVDELMRRSFSRARWRVLDGVRSASREAGESQIGRALPELSADGPATGPVTSSDTRLWLTALIDRLPDHYASVVRACALEGFSNAEAARLLGLEADTVRKRYQRARDLLCRLVNDHGARNG